MADENKITHIGERTERTSSYTPEQILVRALEQLKNKETKATRVLVIFLDDADDAYSIETLHGNAPLAHSIGMLEASKLVMLQNTFDG